ncbi:LemA family protein [Nocardioides massiliensis]|uniref:LemA protein n=1 Tax=Nocardioides massiliensis TaxID=1325935 RepID=A0ABT9NRU3_9ACTN|nr:LemA family protein [Nocardioides massiliensis]MDP9823149.1 LemA protein [Nocardioides massiliensis]
MEPAILVLVGAVVAALLALMVSYNRFVRQRVLIDEAWSGIDVELTRRHDLVPNLVRTVQAHAAHEREVLAGLVAAREAATEHRADAPAARQAYEDRVTAALAQVLVRTEAYPELRASTSFLALQDELAHTEDRIAASRRFYNGNVRAYNTRVRTFPSQLVANAFGFAVRDFFELRDPSLAGVPRVGPDL